MYLNNGRNYGEDLANKYILVRFLSQTTPGICGCSGPVVVIVLVTQAVTKKDLKNMFTIA